MKNVIKNIDELYNNPNPSDVTGKPSGFIDLDQKIETIEKQTISQIFKLKGEKYFRAIEVKTILSLLDSKEKELV